MWSRHKMGCTSTEENFGLDKKKNCTINIAKTKALQLTGGFVFAYAETWFSHDMAHLIQLSYTVSSV